MARSHGFKLPESPTAEIIEFSGTTAQVQEAFHTEIHKFVVNGEEHWANISDPQIPSALAPAVHGSAFLHNFSKKSMIRNVGNSCARQGHRGSELAVTFC